MTLIHYRQLFILSLGGTLLLLLLPGNCLEALKQLLHEFWPWSSPLSTKASDLPIDKLLHGSLFALCGFLLIKGWSLKIHQSAKPWGLLILAGVLTEFLQMVVPGRSMEFSDMLANTLGSTTGMLLARTVGPTPRPGKKTR